jgi:hypothetical protein
MADATKPYGMIAEFRTAAAVLHAAEKVRNAGFSRWDVFTPFPVHGMDRAMGLRNSKVGWFAFLGGVTGYTTGMLMIWWMNAIDYPIVVGGKPMFSPYGAFPPSYERFSLVTHDRFFIAIECDDPMYSETETRKLLEDAGSPHIEVVEE